MPIAKIKTPNIARRNRSQDLGLIPGYTTPLEVSPIHPSVRNHKLINDSAALFILEDDTFLYREDISIKSITWPEIIQQVCQYCGADANPGQKCPGCQNPSPIANGAIGLARILLYAPLPGGLEIFSPPQCIIINYANCGRRDNFDNWDFRIRINPMRICHRTIDSPIATHPQDTAVVHLCVEIEADVILEMRGDEQD